MSESSNSLSRRLRWSQPRRLRRSRRTLLAFVAGSVAFAAAVPVAGAGELRVFSCAKPGGGNLSGVDWKAAYGGGGPAGANACSSDGYLYTALGPERRAAGAWTGFALRAPDGMRIKRIHADRWVNLLAGDDDRATPEYEMVTGTDWDREQKVQERCTYTDGCRGYGWYLPRGTLQSQVIVGFPSGVSFIGFRVHCLGLYTSAGSCGESPNYRAHLQLNSTELLLEDYAAPQIVTPSGSVLQPGARRGVETLTFGATDRGAGVYEAIVRLDGTEIRRTRPDSSPTCADAGVVAEPDLEFDRMQPCSPSLAVAMSLDTTAFAEGKHSLEVLVRDASGNLSSAVAQEIVVDNVPAPASTVKPTISGEAIATGLRPGDAIVAQNGVWTGAGLSFAHRWQRSTVAGSWIDIPNGTGNAYRVGADDVDRQLRVVVTATNAEGSAEASSEATAVVKSGKTVVTQSVKPTEEPAPAPAAATPSAGNGGGGNPATGQLVVDREQRTVDVKYGAKIVITGRLVDGGGSPIADATLDVFEQIAVTAASWTKVGSVKTDSQGGYVYRPSTASSRRLRFAYSDKRDGSDYRATREVFVSVTAGMTIKAKSRKVPRGGLIRLSGQVLVEQLPAKGAWVEVQVLDAGVWRTIATRRVGPTGKWTFKHRLRKASATRFTFRARLRIAGDVPSAEAKSTPLKVRVR